MLRTFLLIGALVGPSAYAGAAEIDWQHVDEALGRKATVTDDAHRYGFPRSDLKVTLDGVAMNPALALGGWVVFKPMHGEAMVMGDLVLLESEIRPVMTSLIDAGFDITALHNHLLRASPATFYMHVGGHGDPVTLAASLRKALALSKTPLTPSSPAKAGDKIDLDTAAIDRIIGAKGRIVGGVYQIGVPRPEPIGMDGMTLTPVGPMGVATAISLQPTGSGKAAITGDFVLLANEVNPVARTLRAHGIEITALHSHMLDEEPRLFFMHFWANDDAAALADGLRAALDKTSRGKR